MFRSWDDATDARTAHLPLVSGGPWKVIFIVIVYLLFVKIVGPRIMRDRKPFDLRLLMLLYNVMLAIGNGLGFIAAFVASSYGRDTFSCLASHVAKEEMSGRNVLSLQDYVYIYGGWLYFISKFIDFLDTIFFVLRKRDRQVSGLHVFHHSFMPIATFIGIKFIPGGNIVLVPLVNTFIHSIMYTYYALSAAGSKYKQYLWWKKYLTLAQVIQFVIIIAHSMYGLMQEQYCSFHPIFHAFELFYASVFFTLFLHFYLKTYVISPTTSTNNNQKLLQPIEMKKRTRIPITVTNINNNSLDFDDTETLMKIKGL
jgi:hypothetical protein